LPAATKPLSVAPCFIPSWVPANLRVNPFIWLKDVLRRISNHPINKIEELLPQNWNPLG